MKKSSLLAAGLLTVGVLGFYSFAFSPALAFKDPPSATSNITPATTTTKSDALQENDITRFTNAIAQIKDYYVQPINDKKLLEDAIRGMLNGLDPHSEYLDTDSYKALLMTTSGEFGGLGIEVTGEFGVLKVISPIDDTPAAKAGIKPGDYIVAIDNKLVNEMTLNESVDMMRGKKGTLVTLTVLRKGAKEPLNFKLIRDTIHITSVKSNMLPGGFGYVRLSQFQQPTTDLMVSSIEKLKAQNGGKLNGLILDLRNNPGGLLETAVQVADVFLDTKKLNNQYKNIIVYTEGRLPSSDYTAKASHPGDILDGAPMVVLVNEGSASASEIVAGALQDYHRAVIVGIATFGKGSVQTVLPLDDHHAIKLTTALYHTPSGRVIQNQGIIPDILIDNLKIAQNAKAEDTTMLQPVREYGLKGHLKGTNDGISLGGGTTDNADNIGLAQSDFQLYEAMKVLKTMAMLHRTPGDSKAIATISKQP